MRNYDACVRINTSLDTKGFYNGVSGITTALKGIGKAIGIAFSTVALIKFGKECIELSSDLAEVDNVVNKSFGSMRGEMDALADTAIKTLGMSRLTAYQTGSTFMAMGKSMLDSSEDAKTMALELTKLTGNMASFYNKSQDLVSIALKSVYTGETETLKQYGIVMTETNLKQFAMEQGITKAYSAMSQSEKVMLRYNYVLQQTSFIGDDFVDTQDSWANQTRILTEQWKEFMTVIGNGLVTVLTPVIKTINSMISSLITFANAVGAVLSKIFGLKQQTIGVSQAAADTATAYGDASDSVEGFSDSTEDSAKASKAAEKEANKLSASFDDLNVLSSPTSSADSGSSGSGGSTGGSAGGINPAEITSALEEEPDTSWLDNIGKKFEPLTKAINNFKESLEPLKTFAAKGIEDFYNDFMVPMGNWVLGEGLPRLIQGLADFNNKVNWGKINKALDDFWKALEPFAENVGEGILWFYEKVLIPLNTWTMNNVVPNFLSILSSALTLVNNAIELVKPVFEWLWDNFLEPIATWTGGVIADVLSDIADTFQKIAENEVAVSILVGLATAIGLVQGALVLYNIAGAIAAGVSTALAIAVDVLGGALAILTSPITLVILAIAGIIAAGLLLIKHWDEVKAKASEIWESVKTTISEAIDKVKTTISNTVDAIKTKWDSVWDAIKTKVSNIWDSIKTKVAETIKSIKSTIEEKITSIKTKWEEVWGSIKKFFSDKWDEISSKVSSIISTVKTTIEDTISTISTNWESVWGGIKKTVCDIWDGIYDHIKNVVNMVIGVINKMIEAIEKGVNGAINVLNKMSFDVPDWVPGIGGSHFGFNISKVSLDDFKIKPLAKGGVIPPNAPFLAMLGDQKSGTNIETPLDTMILAFKSALQDADMAGRGNATVIMEVDKREFGRAAVKFGNAETQRVGISLV